MQGPGGVGHKFKKNSCYFHLHGDTIASKSLEREKHKGEHIAIR